MLQNLCLTFWLTFAAKKRLTIGINSRGNNKHIFIFVSGSSIAEAVYSTASVDCHIGKILRRTLGIIEKAFDTYKYKRLRTSWS